METVEILNDLLQGEISAVETYRQALEKFGGEPAADELSEIELEHEEAADMLKKRILEIGGKPARSSGIWGAWAQAVEGGAKLFGESAAVRVLLEGEEHGIQEYQKAMSDEEETLDAESAALLEIALAKLHGHIAVLNRYIPEKIAK